MFLFDATITAFLAGLGFRFLPDYPHNTKWLSKAEKSLSMKRIELNNPQSTQTGPTKRIEKIKAVVSNKYLYPFIFAWASIHIALGATHLLGIISKKLGFDAITSNLLTTVS
jgi:ACS family pantothenate transporter-like MFS transporter